MRFTLSSTALSSKLSALSRVINSKNALPILGDFVFEISDNILHLTASDSENVMKLVTARCRKGYLGAAHHLRREPGAEHREDLLSERSVLTAYRECG